MEDLTSDFAEHSDHIKVKDLKCWHDMRSTETDNLHVEIKEELKFKVRSDLNKKIFICNGDLTKLEVDAVVLPINDVNLRRSQLAQDIFNTAGTEIHSVYEKYKQNKEMKTGLVSMESGYELPARYIISVMEPKISLKYQSAVETALHGCYVGAFQTASEHDLRSIAFPLLYDPSCEPSLTADMGHIAMRTIRCCLEKLSSKLDSVVLVLTAEQMDLFSNLLSTYFPRSDSEASEFLFWLPSHEFNEWGEIVRADRAIRITDLATTNSETPNIEDPLSTVEEQAIAPSRVDSSFASMSGDHDSQRKNQLRNMTKEKMFKSQERIYHRLLRCARTEDLSQVAATKGLYVCGDDRGGSPVVVLVAKYMDMQRMDLDKALLYFIHILDPLVNEKYSLVYFHTMSQSSNHPSLDFIRHVYTTLDRRYRANLKYLYIVHPTFWSKVFVWLFTTFSASEVKGQVLPIKNIPQLYQFISSDQIDIPPFVVDYDLKANSATYNVENPTNSNRKL